MAELLDPCHERRWRNAFHALRCSQSARPYRRCSQRLGGGGNPTVVVAIVLSRGMCGLSQRPVSAHSWRQLLLLLQVLLFIGEGWCWLCAVGLLVLPASALSADAQRCLAAPAEFLAGVGFAACAGKHYFVIGTKAAFRRTHASVPSGLPP